MKKKSLVGYMDFNKDLDEFIEYSFTYSRPTTRHTNPDVVSKKVGVRITELGGSDGKRD